MHRAYRMAYLIPATLLMVFAAACVSSTEPAKNGGEVAAAVRAVIEEQQAAWNRGDIEGFMEGYERADTTTFISGDQLTRGWQTVLDRYRKRYSSQDLMGTLTFSDVDIQPVSPLYVLADGRWALNLANDTPHGRFTLLFRLTRNGWRITHDTTTSAE